MGRWRKAIYIGRDDPDTGLGEFRKLAKARHITLEIFNRTPNASKYIPQYDVVFASGYLTILEGLAAGVPILAYYNSSLRHDYLTMTPFASYITVFSKYNDVELEYNIRVIKAGQKWAKSQTWERLADMYESLWQR